MTEAVITTASPQHLGRYRVERALGSGKHSKVFLAWDEGEHGFRKRVALKVLPLQSKPGAADALHKEARLLAALNHPNVVDVYGVGTTNGRHFIVMEYVPGSTLEEIREELEHHGLRFPRSVACDIGIAVAEGLYAAWNARDAAGTRLNIVHRDLKPANVLMSRLGDVKVSDFGVAKAASDLTQTLGRRMKGTPSYMSPELMKGSRDFRPSMDLWSLGVMLWEMCAGHRFYGRVSLHDLISKLDSRTPEEEASAVASYFSAIAPVVERLLARDPADRYQDPRKVARKLRRIRAAMGVTPSLTEFFRLMRGSGEPTQAADTSLPTLLATPKDWEPLIELAQARRRPSTTEPIHLVTDMREALAMPLKLEAKESVTEDHGAESPARDLSFRAPQRSAAVAAIEALSPSAFGKRSMRRLRAGQGRASADSLTLYWIGLGIAIAAAVAAVVMASGAG